MTDALAKATIITLAAVILFLLVMFGGKLVIDRDDFIEKNVISLLESAGFENVKVYDSSEITPDILENREGKTIVERCYGIVLDMETGDGRIINAADGAVLIFLMAMFAEFHMNDDTLLFWIILIVSIFWYFTMFGIFCVIGG